MKFDNDYYEISKDFKLLSFNKAVEKRYKGIKVGDYCYKATMNRDSPCLHCPIAGNAESECPIYYDPFYDGWVQANFSQFTDDTYTVICHPAEPIGMELLGEEGSEKVKNVVLGKAANSELQKMIHEQSNIIDGFKGVFFAAYIIDLEKKYYKQLFLNPDASNISPKAEGFAEPTLKLMVEKGVSVETKESMVLFNDIETMAKRIGDKGILYQDYIGVQNGWCRASLIPIERDEKGTPIKIIYGTTVIQGDFKDSLTGCNNRKALNWAYDKNNKSEESIGVIMCDVNGLKSINDTKGHEAGDQYLLKAAGLFDAFFGSNKVYRIGGDEFVIVLIGEDKTSIANKVLEFKEKCEGDNVSISLGYEFCSHFNKSFEEILKAADNKMYAAKRDYYNRVSTSDVQTSDLGPMGEYFDSLIDFGSSCNMVVRIDILNNSYKLVRTKEGYDTSFVAECKTLKDFFMYPVTKKFIHTEDIKDYEQWISETFSNNPETLKMMPAKNQTWFKYRSNYSRKRYRAVEAFYFPGRNFSQDNQYGYVYLMNKGLSFDSSHITFEDVLKNLAENYETIFYIDVDSMKIVPYRMSRHAAKSEAGKLAKNGDIFNAIKQYIETFVADSDKEDIRKICTKEFLQEQLKVKGAYTRDYLAVVNGNEVYYRIKFSNMEGPGELHHCAIGFTNINSEILHKKELEISGSSILVVEDSIIDRELIKSILEPEYKVIEAENGLEAQNILSQSYHDISLIITGLEMPECDGYELLEILQQHPFYKVIPTLVVTSLKGEESKIRCLEMGAVDFINKPFNRKIILNRVASILRLSGTSSYYGENEIDSLTGLYTSDAFYRYAQIIIDSNPGTNYVIMLSDIIGFKALNEQYGKEKCDELLKFMAKPTIFGSNGFFIGGRISGDIFACIISEDRVVELLSGNVLEEQKQELPIPNVIVKFGIYYANQDENISIQQMCDRAGIALNSIKNQYDVTFAKYDEVMRNNMLLEQKILDTMEIALEEEQFEVYFQPKHNVYGKDLAGAETLVRWNHPTMGFMNPGIFIPLFEKNGFISKLDKYVWRKTCEEIANLIKMEKEFPISINVSRRDFSDPNLADTILELTNEYNIPHNLLHIEVTESAYSENPELLKKTVGMLHANGFIIELDDFGTGYSSLTAINSFDIDIIKLDMSLIKSDSASEGRSVLEFSMQLAKMMNVKTIQEGVETEEEYNRMKELGCDYIQGFYFSKPLPKKDFEDYVKNN